VKGMQVFDRLGEPRIQIFGSDQRIVVCPQILGREPGAMQVFEFDEGDPRALWPILTQPTGRFLSDLQILPSGESRQCPFEHRIGSPRHR